MIKITLTPDRKDRLIKKYLSYKLENANQYILFTAIVDNIRITIFKNKKEDVFKCNIQGDKEKEFAILNGLDFIEEEQIVKSKEIIEYECFDSQIGSDEVGFGDFLGPIIVVATYVDKSVIPFILESGIKDSKKISDAKILDLVPKIINKIDYSLLKVTNEKLNELRNLKSLNLNEVKAQLHNKALNNVYEKHKNVGKNIFVDQFIDEIGYYTYIKGIENNIPSITFKTKGEQRYPSVAIASCIARYHFLKEMDKLSLKYGVEIPRGAGAAVDTFAAKFIKKYGIDELKKICKTTFKNYKSLL